VSLFQDSFQYFWKNYQRYRSDWINPICMMILSIIGVFFIYSAQIYNQGTRWKMQIGAILLGAIVYLIVSSIPYKWYLRHAHLLYGISIFLLLLVWTPLGVRWYGCLRWLNFRVFYLQPSEVAKMGALILGSGILARSEIIGLESALTVIFRVGLIFLVPIVLIFLQPDLGSSLIFLPMLFAMLYVSNIPQRFFVIALIVCTACIALVSWDVLGYHRFLVKHNLSPMRDKGAYEAQAWLPLKDYQRNRILSFAAPQLVDPKGVGVSWNLRQSLISVGSGGLWGKGHTRGTQAKLGYLPQAVAPNDFIFSVLAEEAGFVGGLAVIFLYVILIGNSIRIAGLANDRFGMYLAVGITALFITHIFINMGMTIGLMPITGIPLPFLSYGGSFVVNCCILQGIIQSVYRFRKDFS
jgi:rod shape determining protein RodA